MKQETFLQIKAEVLRLAKAGQACSSAYSRAECAENINNLMEVILDNIYWCISHDLINSKMLEMIGDDVLFQYGIYRAGTRNHNIEIAEGHRNIYFLGNSSATVVTRGNGSATVETWGDSSATVVTYDNSSARVRTRGDSSATVITWGDSSATVKTRGYSSATVETRGYSSATVKTSGNSSATVETRGYSSATVKTSGNSSATVETWENSIIRDLTKNILYVQKNRWSIVH